MGDRPTIPAVVYGDRVENAIRRQVQAERMAEYLTQQRLDPTDPAAEDLRNVRREAALLEATGWREYAKRNENLRADAAAHEAGEREVLRFGQDERRSRYDEDGAA